jgi:hypothetical protein
MEGTSPGAIMSWRRQDGQQVDGGVSNVDIDENNTLQIQYIGVTISTFETLPKLTMPHSAMR